VIGALLRVFSYLYHTALAILLLGVALVALVSRSHTLQLGMLPWKGSTLTYWLLGTGLFGLLSIWYALRGKLRFLFLLYSMAVFGMMFRGYFLGVFAFHGKEEFRFAAGLTGAALLAILGAISVLAKKSKKKGWRR